MKKDPIEPLFDEKSMRQLFALFTDWVSNNGGDGEGALLTKLNAFEELADKFGEYTMETRAGPRMIQDLYARENHEDHVLFTDGTESFVIADESYKDKLGPYKDIVIVI